MTRAPSGDSAGPTRNCVSSEKSRAVTSGRSGCDGSRSQISGPPLMSVTQTSASFAAAHAGIVSARSVAINSVTAAVCTSTVTMSKSALSSVNTSRSPSGDTAGKGRPDRSRTDGTRPNRCRRCRARAARSPRLRSPPRCGDCPAATRTAVPVSASGKSSRTRRAGRFASGGNGMSHTSSPRPGPAFQNSSNCRPSGENRSEGGLWMACVANGPGSYCSNFAPGSVAVQIPIFPVQCATDRRER